MAAQSGITFIGIGNMGLASVLALLKSGSPVTVWNRTAARPQVITAVDAGAHARSGPRKSGLQESAHLCLLSPRLVF